MRYLDEEGDDDDFDERGILKDGRSFRVPARMQDGMQRDIADHFAQLTGRDSTVFPRLNQRPFISDAWGGTADLHRPVTCWCETPPVVKANALMTSTGMSWRTRGRTIQPRALRPAMSHPGLVQHA
jgi:hypothetical protein